MAEQCCDCHSMIESRCVIDGTAVPFPRFQLFEIAVMQWENDDEGVVSREVVQVVGMAWNPADANIIGWWYHVRSLRKRPGSQLKEGHQEDCYGKDLKKWVPFCVPVGDKTVPFELPDEGICEGR